MRVIAPGRVNLIGEHTDYTGGLVFPMAIDRWTTIDYEVGGSGIVLDSADEDGTFSLTLGQPFDASMTPSWGRYVGAVASQMDSPRGISGHISTSIPVGAGLSSSAALEIAVALALGCELSSSELAQLTQRAEHLATGVPTGIMDQLCITSARQGHGALIDCTSLAVRHIPIPSDVKIVVRFIAHRTLVGSAYADRVAQCATAESIIGPLRNAAMSDIAKIDNKIIAALFFYSLLAYCYIKIFSETSVSKSYTLIQVLQVLVVVLFGYFFYSEEVNWLGIISGVISIYLFCNCNNI